MKHQKPALAFFGLKGLPATGGTAAVGQQIVAHLYPKYAITVYATASHASNPEPYPGVKQRIFRAYFPGKWNVLYYNLISAFHALIFGNYQVVHVHQIDIAFLIPLLRLRFQVVATHHGKTYLVNKWSSIMRKFFKWNERLMLKWAHATTFVAQTERDDLLREFPGNYLHIPNGIEQSVLEHKAAFPPYLFFAAGRVIPHKGCHVFLEALRLIHYKGKVFVAGNHTSIPGYQAELEAYAQTLDLTFLGMIAHKQELLNWVAGAQLFVFPSFYEAMSMMLLEVVSVQTPLVLSDIRENRAVLNESEAWFFCTGDASDLASQLTVALSNSNLSHQKAQQAWSRLKLQYSWPHIAAQYHQVYQSRLKSKS